MKTGGDCDREQLRETVVSAQKADIFQAVDDEHAENCRREKIPNVLDESRCFLIFPEDEKRKKTREQAEDDEHGRDHEGVRSEADETQCGYRKPDDGGNVIFFLQPLVEKDDDEHGCHDKTDPGCVKLQQRADQSAGCGADGPVEIVQ